MDNTGKKVKVHYIGTFNDGEKFDSSYDRNEPLEFVCMAGMLVPGFDEAVRDMEVGQTIDVHLTPDQAYGERNEEDVITVPTTSIPNGDQMPVGKTVYMQEADGIYPVKVVSIEDGMVTLDFNHPMAGKELNFNITLVEATEDAIPMGGSENIPAPGVPASEAAKAGEAE